MKKLIMLFFILLNPSFALTDIKENFWVSIDNEELRYAQVNGGILLNNQSKYEIEDIEIQTYPSASNGLTRLLGIGSYYFKINSLDIDKTARINWEKLSNTDGEYLKLDKYAFNRISISGTKKIKNKKESINQHFKVDPEFTVENRGFPIHFKNKCRHPIKIAIRYKNLSGDWATESWWEFNANKSAYLSVGGNQLLTGDTKIYYYAESTDSSSWAWGSESDYHWIGLRKYGMRTLEDSEGETNISLTCDK